MNARLGCFFLAFASFAAMAAPPPAPASTPAASPVDRMFATWDTDHNGNLTRDEFRAGWTTLQTRLQVEARLKAQFARLDANHDGAIDGTEYANVVLAKQAGAAAPLSRFDSNRDKKLDFAEYLWLVEALAPHAPAAATKGR